LAAKRHFDEEAAIMMQPLLLALSALGATSGAVSAYMVIAIAVPLENQ
jgi:hypothetical protein